MSTKGDEHSLEVLRDLLLAPERKRVDALSERLDNPQLRRQQTRDALEDVLTREPESFARHLVPVILPVLRNAMVAQLREYMRSLEALVEQTLTLRAVRWRWVSWRTGASVQEVALGDTQLGQMEQLLLLHTPTGLAVAHALQEDARAKDIDVVSGMISAVGAFVQEAFSDEGERGGELERMEFGERELWLARGRWLTLAAAVRGVGAARLRDRLFDVLERVESRHAEALAGFDGSEDLRPQIDPVLLEYLDGEPRQPARWARWILVVILLGALGALAYTLDQRRRSRAAVQTWATQLAARPGVVVVDRSWRADTLHVVGLRDGLVDALPPPPEDGRTSVHQTWHGYQSTEPELVLERARRALEPPEGVRLSLSGATLVLAGEAPTPWLQQAIRRAPLVAGVGRVDAAELRDPQVAAIHSALAELEGLKISFAVGARRPKDPAEAQPILDLVTKIDRLAASVDAIVRLRAVGGADLSGSVRLNRRLADARGTFLGRAVAQLRLDHIRVEAIPPGEIIAVQNRTARIVPREDPVVFIRSLNP